MTTTRTCVCGNLIPIPSWKTCSKCKPKRKPRTTEPTRHFVIYDFIDVQRVFKIPHNFKKIPLHEKEYLLYDEEKMEIIGYK
jgi:hypothetical protein